MKNFIPVELYKRVSIITVCNGQKIKAHDGVRYYRGTDDNDIIMEFKLEVSYKYFRVNTTTGTYKVLGYVYDKHSIFSKAFRGLEYGCATLIGGEE